MYKYRDYACMSFALQRVTHGTGLTHRTVVPTIARKGWFISQRSGSNLQHLQGPVVERRGAQALFPLVPLLRFIRMRGLSDVPLREHSGAGPYGVPCGACESNGHRWGRFGSCNFQLASSGYAINKALLLLSSCPRPAFESRLAQFF